MQVSEVQVRAAKYLFEGIAVAVVALLLGGLTLTQTVVLASTASAAFAVLDVLMPAVCLTADPSRDRRAA